MLHCKRWLTLFLFILIVFSFALAEAETVIKTNGISAEELGDFASRHPDVRIDSEDYTYYETTGQIISDLLTQSFDYDVFGLSNSIIDYPSIFDKGYCLDLSSSEKIRAAIDRLYPTLRAQCTDGDAIYAVPSSIQLNYMGFSTDVLAETGLGAVAVPTSFPEFLDFVERWIDYLKHEPECDIALMGKSYWLLESDYNSQAYTMAFTEWLLDNYIMQKEFAGEPLTFDEPELLALLSRAAQLGNELYLYDQGVKCTKSIVRYLGPHAPDEGYSFLSLRLNADQPALISAYLRVDAVNARTQHPELCLELVEALIENNHETFSAYLYQDAEPVPNRNYDDQVALQEQFVQQYQQQLQRTDLDEVEREEAEANLEQRQFLLQELLENEDAKYSITASTLAAYRAHTDYLYFSTPGVFAANNKEVANTFKQLKARFVGGQIAAEELTRELRRVAQMVEMEQGE